MLSLRSELSSVLSSLQFSNLRAVVGYRCLIEVMFKVVLGVI